MSLSLFAIFIAIGCGSGFLAGLFGVGGGLVIVPILTFLLPKAGIPLEQAVPISIATASCTIVFTSIQSFRTHHQKGAVDWPLVATFVPGLIVGSFVASTFALPTFSSKLLTMIFVVIVFYSSYQMLKPQKQHATKNLPAKPFIALVGSGIGLFSGLVGAGGGFLSVPYMTQHNVSIHKAVGTSSAMGFFIGLANTLSSIAFVKTNLNIPWLWGLVYVPAVLSICLTSMVFAPIGARVAHRLDTIKLKRYFAILLIILALTMLAKNL